ncbi:hypothetical protein ACFE04_015800 [Oxalis oulophora]
MKGGGGGGGGESSFWIEEHHATNNNDDDDDDFTLHNPPTPKRRQSKKLKLEFTGWGSTPLIRFLLSQGHNTTNKLSQFEVSSIVNNYVHANRLIHPIKKKRIVCDANLLALFGKKTIGRNKMYELLDPHFAENREDDSEDDLDDLFNSSDDENNKERKELLLPIVEPPRIKRIGFAAIIPDNIKRVCLKKSLIEELLVKDPLPTLEAKMVGSFVRIKNDPLDYMQKASHQLLLVKGVKQITENNTSSPKILFQVFNYKDIPISIISDENFTEKECESLLQKMNDGLLKKPTIVEFEEKVQALHEDITKHLDRGGSA